MNGNVITANFWGGRMTMTTPLWQYDYGQVLRFTGVSLPETYEVHFSNAKRRGDAKTAIGDANGVVIPDEFLATGDTVYAWIFLHATQEDGETEYMATIPVNKRAMPSDEAPTPQEQSAITQAIAALNSAVVDVQEAVEAADDAMASATSAGASATAAAASEAGVAEDADRASAAATAAESAQGAAEAAQAGAETAQTGAESARDEAAQASAAQIAQINATGAAVLESIPADYTELSDSVSNLKSALNTKAGIIRDTASGAIASFVPDATIPDLLGLSVALEPIQDLHGYDSPWPAGGGKNKFDQDTFYASYKQSDGSFILLGSQSGSERFYIPSELVEKQLTFSAMVRKPSGSTITNIRVACNVGGTTTYGNNVNASSYTLTQITFTPTSTSDFVLITYGSNGEQQLQFKDVQLEIGSSATTFATYSNLCPISGRDSVEVTRTGVNLFDTSIFTKNGGVLQENGMYYFSAVSRLINKVFYKNSGYTGQLVVTLERKTNVDIQTLRAIIFYTDGTSEKVGGLFATGEVDTYTVVTASDKIVDRIAGDYGYNIGTYARLQIELGSTATSYHPYAGNRYTIQLGDTVYGGTLDVTAGTLTVDRAMVDLGSLIWTYSSPRFIANVAGMPNKAGGTIQMVCSAFPCLTQGEPYDPSVDFVAYGAFGKLYVHDSQYTDAAIFTTAMSGVQLVYELATPIVIDLDPVQIATIANQTNNVWADAGDVSVEFAADLKHYIDSKIAAAVAALS